MPKTLTSALCYLRTRPLEFLEILVVDDGSTDRTAACAQTFADAHASVRVLTNPRNLGKGHAVRQGMLAAQGEWRLFSDADLSTPIEELDKLWLAVESSPADIAIGSRALDRELIAVRQSLFRETAGKFFNVVMRAVAGLPFRDTQCGFKLFSRAAAELCFPRQRLERFGFDVEVLFIAQRKGLRTVEVPVRWSHAEGTKVSIWNGAQSFLDLLRIRRNQIAGNYE